MELYTTAELELVSIDEDVITASVQSCEPYYTGTGNSTAPDGWTVIYSDGSTANYAGSTAPDVCS